VHLQAREWQFGPDSASQRQFTVSTLAVRYSLIETVKLVEIYYI